MSTRPARPGPLWEIAVRLCLLSDTHIGAARAVPRHAAEGDVDLRVDRDPRTGVPRLRATTLAGLLRHELAARTEDPRRVGRLFGAAESGPPPGGEPDAPAASALDVDDAAAELPEGTTVAVRVGTRVDPASGTVRPGLMWQWEVLPAGTVFTAHMRLRVPAPADEEPLLDLLVLAADGFSGEGPGIRVGGRTGRGHGAVRATHWTAERHDLTDERAWFAYHARSWADRWERGAAALADAPAELSTALAARLRAHGRAAAAARLEARPARPDRRHRAELRLTLAVAEQPDPGGPPPRSPRPGLIMVGDVPAPERLGTVDRAHRHRPVVSDADKASVRLAPVLGDTALFALFKRIGGRLVRDAAEHLGAEGARWQEWHAHWWGADTGPEGARPRPSRVRLRAVPPLSGGAHLTATRLTVDSLFGDAVDGRVFTSDLHCGGSGEVVLDVRDPDDAVRGLLVLVVRELATVPFDTLGAGAGSGNGRLTATRAALTTWTGGGGPPHRVDLLTALFAPGSAEAATARGWVSALRTRLAPGGGAARGEQGARAGGER
ncbi:RAMP superfamily CRISPR-associated protein [Nocardiopsis sp. CA-288880]|uniref:RAMP superfamily CRISPR-associated protein n=1 Tax=Nocardiopsis sp. CA-288880 TaxID=3239995 RepID=UPI003D97776A